MNIDIRKILFYLLLVVTSLWFMLPEISLLTNDLLFKNIDSALSKKRVVYHYNLPYTLEFMLPQDLEIDLNKSYIAISGSNYLSTNSPETYISFLDRITVIETIPLTSDKIHKDNNLYKYTFPQNTEGQTSIIEIYLIDEENNLKYDWQIASNSTGFGGLFLSRYSYLIQYLIWIYAIFGSVRGRKNWSTVYDSITKKPISGAVIRVYKDDVLYTTLLTSVTGIIDEKFPKGKYRIEVSKIGYEYPSKLKPLIKDGKYNNLYYATQFQIYKDGSRLNLNIPLDPIDKNNSLKNYFNIIDSTIDSFNPYLLSSLAILQIIIWPTYLESYIFGGIGFILISLQQIFKSIRRKKPGIVIDKNNKPVANLTLNLYESEWNKLIQSTITNSEGEYEFLTTPNNYYIKIDGTKYSIDNSEKKIDIHKKYTDTMYINEKIVVATLPTSRTSTSTTTSSTKTNSTTTTTTS